MMSDLINGFPASRVFAEILSSDLSLTGRDLSRLFAEQFPKTGSGAVQLIRLWKGGGRLDGISDDDLDVAVAGLLKEAGYITDGL